MHFMDSLVAYCTYCIHVNIVIIKSYPDALCMFLFGNFCLWTVGLESVAIYDQFLSCQGSKMFAPQLLMLIPFDIDECLRAIC